MKKICLALQDDVKRQLDEIAEEHRNIRQWAACLEGDECPKGNKQDVWKRVRRSGQKEGSERKSSSRSSSKTPGSGKGSKDSRGRKSPASKVNELPYSKSDWKDSKPAVSWRKTKPRTLLAGYELANCMVAAEKDKGIVEVKIVEKVPALMTRQGDNPSNPSTRDSDHGKLMLFILSVHSGAYFHAGPIHASLTYITTGCKCKMPWKMYEMKEKDGQIYESKTLRTYNRCSENGSPGEPVSTLPCQMLACASHGHGHYCDACNQTHIHRRTMQAFV